MNDSAHHPAGNSALRQGGDTLPQSTSADDLLQDGDTIARDLPCLFCDYNLRTLRLDSDCPECGALVLRTTSLFQPAMQKRLARLESIAEFWCFLLGCPLLAVLCAGLVVLLENLGYVLFISVSGFSGLAMVFLMTVLPVANIQLALLGRPDRDGAVKGDPVAVATVVMPFVFWIVVVWSVWAAFNTPLWSPIPALALVLLSFMAVCGFTWLQFRNAVWGIAKKSDLRVLKACAVVTLLTAAIFLVTCVLLPESGLLLGMSPRRQLGAMVIIALTVSLVALVAIYRIRQAVWAGVLRTKVNTGVKNTSNENT